MNAKMSFLFLFALSACQENEQKNHQPNISDQAAELSKHHIIALQNVPLNGLQVLYGNPEMEGAHFVIRLHNDSGYVVLPHTHPRDENIVVIKGTWMFSMGNKINLSSIDTLGVGAYAYVPNKMAHFGYAKTEVIVQIHGIGPFSTEYVDSVFQLTTEGVSLIHRPNDKGIPVKSDVSKYFAFKIGETIRSESGSGTVLLGQCHPRSNLTQYLIKSESGNDFGLRLIS